ncbi:hypothetical protein [Streptomyces spectabilis]|uniref:DUF4232 domain-containing protein n=1 Tax=Streptomyces spectabilis TaxID=68270 RepID=A0A516RJ93_STRST|nr:hypothetical protein [Streptomyces spectabilis]QDQ15736.1 hypothetical protein FH965_38580 [Streptomyces spectabilis]
MTRAPRRAASAVALFCLLVPLSGCGGDKGASQGQSNENGNNLACNGHHVQCVNGTLIVSPLPPSPSSSNSAPPSPSDSPSPSASPSPGRTPSPTPTDDGRDSGGDGSDTTAARLDRAPRAVLRGPGLGSLRIALIDVDSPQPRWSTLGIGARHLRAAGVGGVLFRLPSPVPASVSVDTAQAADDVEYAFFDGNGLRLGTRTAASCAVLCPSLTQNLVTAPQYQYLLVTDVGRSAGWPLGQRYIVTNG